MSPFIDGNFERQALDREEELRQRVKKMRDRRYASVYKKKMRSLAAKRRVK